jgi:site-specific recombinase XerD
MKFFYHQILGWDEQKLFLPPRKGSWRLPEVLSQKEVERLLYANDKLRKPLSFDDGLCHRSSGQRAGQA